MLSSTTASPADFTVDCLQVSVYASAEDLAVAAAAIASNCLRQAIARRGGAAIVFATGNSQLAFLDSLAKESGVDWSRVTGFHLDEYLGLPASHPSSFRAYLRERVRDRLRLGAFHELAGDALEPIAECDRYGRLLERQPIDVCCLGIGANGHLAFNDPPVANRHDARAVKLVRLERTNRQQQVDSGLFPTLDAVPPYALTLTLPAILSASCLLCLAPGASKAAIVRQTLQGAITSDCPASFLRTHNNAYLFLDKPSARLVLPAEV